MQPTTHIKHIHTLLSVLYLTLLSHYSHPVPGSTAAPPCGATAVDAVAVLPDSGGCDNGGGDIGGGAARRTSDDGPYTAAALPWNAPNIRCTTWLCSGHDCDVCVMWT